MNLKKILGVSALAMMFIVTGCDDAKKIDADNTSDQSVKNSATATTEVAKANVEAVDHIPAVDVKSDATAETETDVAETVVDVAETTMDKVEEIVSDATEKVLDMTKSDTDNVIEPGEATVETPSEEK